jgi:hypothetical protein
MKRGKRPSGSLAKHPIIPGRYFVVSSTDHPISDKSRLWRYLTFEKFCWLLEKAQLYHARLDKLGDPFEGTVTTAYARKRDTGTLPEHLQEHPVVLAHEPLMNKGRCI